MTDGPISSPAAGGSRALRIALAVSVALNLAVVGVVGGAMLRPHDARHDRTGPRDLGFGFYNDALTPADRSELRRLFLASRPALLQERGAVRREMDLVLAALRADPFDPAALDAAMQAQIDRLQARFAVGQGLLHAFVVAMTPAARAAFADRLEAAAARRAAPGRDRHGG